MKRYYSNIALTIATLMLLGTVSCKKSLTDINHDPLKATSVDPSLLLPYVILDASSVRVIEFLGDNMYSQQWSGVGFWKDKSRYVLGIPITNNGWNSWYNDGLKNLFLIRDLVEKNRPKDIYITAQAKVMEAFIYSQLTQIWGDVPFSQAINQEYSYPKFDSQEEVLEGIVTRLDEAIALFNQNTNSDIIIGGDLLFHGDKDAWIRWANSLKLNMLMLLANKKPQEVAAKIQALENQPLILTKAQEPSVPYSDKPGEWNPRYTYMINSWGDNNPQAWYASDNFLNLMNSNKDPRRATFFDATAAGTFVGQRQGTGVFNVTKFSRLNDDIFVRPNTPDVFSRNVQTYFLLADAAANGYISGGLSKANTYFRNGVQASLDYYDGTTGAISAADKQTFMNSFPDLSTLGKDAALDLINDQHYIALFNNGLDAWTQWRRTKSVQLYVPTNALASDVIRKYTYPESEANTNPNTPTDQTLEKPMWFEK